ncbi:polysaccharide deacetylase family protein [Caulobacter sp. CCNWLY153]|uniref:polysaccharide deacetylase family protein n=1 Tax=unclassified Caulobacter TaxID=2648921 RepID=UPI002FEF2D26
MKALLAIVMSLGMGLLGGITAANATQWPNGAKAAVALTYDDALVSQLDNAIPALDAAGLRGSFFLSGVKAADIPRWRAAAAQGHELANHTIFHACPAANFPADPRYVAEAYTPASLLKEIEQQNVLLTAIDGKARHGFATPCGASKAGGVDYLEALRASGLATYARGVVTTPEDLAGRRIDPMHVPARGFPEGVTGAQLIDFAKSASAGGGVAVFLFHGVSGDYLQVSNPAHQELLAWLKANPGQVWVAPLQEVMDWAAAHP